MAALTKERNTPARAGNVIGYPVKASVKCLLGGLAVLSGGYAAPGSVATALVAVGRFEETVDNAAGASGDVSVRVAEGTFKYANSAAGDLITQADAGNDCYVVDDQTVAKTNGSSTRSRAGKIEAVDADGVWVRIGLGV